MTQEDYKLATFRSGRLLLCLSAAFVGLVIVVIGPSSHSALCSKSEQKLSDFHGVRSANNNDSSLQVNPSFDLAFQESFGFFDNIANPDWKLHQERFRSQSLFQDKAREPKHGDATKISRWLLYNVDPMFTCPHVRRIGGWTGDGPKWVCDPHRLEKLDDCLVYSIGSKGNYIFEDGLNEYLGNKKHCEIHTFDPSPKYARENDPVNKNM
jgi:hypothetical protein